MKQKPFKLLVVCTGNICRSPTAEGVLRKKIADIGMSKQIFVDSAGTHGYHVGEAPDERSCHAARYRGYDLSKLTSRRVKEQDFFDFD
ncbi:MAG: low molecular weight phosphotyrosine protein phosphatase, partial [Betaproteobacteria bacterium]